MFSFSAKRYDSDYLLSCVNDLTSSNVSYQSQTITDIIEQLDRISRKVISPFLDKIKSFLEEGYIDESTKLLYILYNYDKIPIRSIDFKDILEYVLSNKDLYDSTVIPPLLGAISSTLNSLQDLVSLTQNISALVEFSQFTTNPLVMDFITSLAKYDVSSRVPLVFSGLVEQILPTLSVNDSHFKLLSMLISDSKSKKYFLDMNHVSIFADHFFASNISDYATEAFLELLSKEDLINLRRMQDAFFETDTFSRLLVIAGDRNNDDSKVINSLICISSLLTYNNVEHEKSFHPKLLIEIVLFRPSTRLIMLHVIEQISIFSPNILFHDSFIVNNTDIASDIFFTLYCCYLCFDATKTTILDLEIIDLANLRSKEKLLYYVLSIQRKIRIDSAPNDFYSENLELAALASVNLLLCHKEFPNRGECIQKASHFFNSVEFNKVSVEEIVVRYPARFITWGKDAFSRCNIGHWMKSTKSNATLQTNVLVNITREQTSAELRELNQMLDELNDRNEELKAKIEVLTSERETFNETLLSLQGEILDVRSNQLKAQLEKN